MNKLFLAALLVGCSGTDPPTYCAPLEGTYNLSYTWDHGSCIEFQPNYVPVSTLTFNPNNETLHCNMGDPSVPCCEVLSFHRDGDNEQASIYCSVNADTYAVHNLSVSLGMAPTCSTFVGSDEITLFDINGQPYCGEWFDVSGSKQ